MRILSGPILAFKTQRIISLSKYNVEGFIGSERGEREMVSQRARGRQERRRTMRPERGFDARCVFIIYVPHATLTNRTPKSLPTYVPTYIVRFILLWDTNTKFCLVGSSLVIEKKNERSFLYIATKFTSYRQCWAPAPIHNKHKHFSENKH